MNFPNTLKHGCNRSCNEEYLKNGFVYSKKHDAVFCIYCVLFLPSSKKQSLGAFVQRGYKEWHNILEKEKKYLGNKYHQEAFEQATSICRRFEDPQHTLPLQSNEILKTRHQTYPYIIETLARIIHLMGKQGLAFRGTHENIGESAQKGNPGNFLAIVQEIAHHNPALIGHIEAPLRKDVSYLGPKVKTN